MRWGSDDDSSSVGADSESETLPRALLYDGFGEEDDEGDIESGMALPQLTTAAVLTLQDNPNFIVGLSLQDRVEWLASALVGASTKVVQAVAEHGAAAVNKLLHRATYPALPTHVLPAAHQPSDKADGCAANGLALSPSLQFLDYEAGSHAEAGQSKPKPPPQPKQLCDELQQLQFDSGAATGVPSAAMPHNFHVAQPPRQAQHQPMTHACHSHYHFVVPASGALGGGALASAGSVHDNNAEAAESVKSPFTTPQRPTKEYAQNWTGQFVHNHVVCTPGSVGGSSVASAAVGCHSKVSSPPSPGAAPAMPSLADSVAGSSKAAQIDQ